MPWKECHVEEERLRFIARLRDGEKKTRLCAEFGISRKTGYKIRDRWRRAGAKPVRATAQRQREHDAQPHQNICPPRRR
jgi:transposase